MLRYVPRVRDIPLYHGMPFDPTWKALQTHRLTREVLQKRAKQPKSKVVALRSCFTSFAYEWVLGHNLFSSLTHVGSNGVKVLCGRSLLASPLPTSAGALSY
ncbi:hypothetical protein Salat_2579600 [Sesamum alatum]|uniref:Uncharacterized protein n=1 Tax=Sesamum alatum TaxID=300844 RepID=A0AAE1XMR0_9LAMI|nr:hypothetical protein Salat_2579600 [Sesamum alatum]